MLQIITDINTAVNNLVWGIPAMVCIIGVGLYLSLRTRFIQFRKFGHTFRFCIAWYVYEVFRGYSGRAFQGEESARRLGRRSDVLY